MKPDYFIISLTTVKFLKVMVIRLRRTDGGSHQSEITEKKKDITSVVTLYNGFIRLAILPEIILMYYNKRLYNIPCKKALDIVVQVSPRFVRLEVYLGDMVDCFNLSIACSLQALFVGSCTSEPRPRRLASVLYTSDLTY